MPVTATLTERYLGAVVARVPESQRAEVRLELAERIADTVDARTAAGQPPADAEYATLAELGDPEVLAASYADRPLHLVGPRYYLLWKRLVTLLVPIVAIASAAGTTIGNVLDGEPIGSVVAGIFGAAAGGAVWVLFWVTAVLAVIERIPAADAATRRELTGHSWKPERLPQVTGPDAREIRNDQILSIGLLALGGAFVFFANRATFFWVDGEAQQIPVFQPETWAWLRWALLVVIAAEIALAVATMVRRRRTWTLAVVHLCTGIAFAALTLPPLVSGHLINAEVFEVTGWAEHFRPGGVGVTVGVVVVLVAAFADVVERFVLTWRDERRSSFAG